MNCVSLTFSLIANILRSRSKGRHPPITWSASVDVVLRTFELLSSTLLGFSRKPDVGMFYLKYADNTVTVSLSSPLLSVTVATYWLVFCVMANIRCCILLFFFFYLLI